MGLSVNFEASLKYAGFGLSYFCAGMSEFFQILQKKTVSFRNLEIGNGRYFLKPLLVEGFAFWHFS